MPEGAFRRFFVDPGVIRGPQVTLTGDLAHRLARVLRVRVGDRIVLATGDPTEHVVRLDAVSPASITGTLVAPQPAPPEPAVEVVLYQSLIRPNRFDYAIEKGTEVGVARFVPVINARSQSDEASSARTERWERIIVEAAEQCGRGRLPTVGRPMPFEDAICAAPGLRILPWEDERDIKLADHLRALTDRPQTVSVFIGPEGGHTDEEMALARDHDAAIVTLGRRVLRSETAAVVACGIILHELDD